MPNILLLDGPPNEFWVIIFDFLVLGDFAKRWLKESWKVNFLLMTWEPLVVMRGLFP
jgi:hypothetical protein